MKTNCPRDCYDNCGIVVLTGQDGKVVVRGDPDHPINRGTICAKCSTSYNGVWQDPTARLTSPLRRTGPKGSGEFTPISWDEAISEIVEKTQGIVGEFGGSSVLNMHYTGTISLLAFSTPMRFFNKLGATEVEPDSICNLTGHIAWTDMFGISVAGFDPRTAKDSNCLFVWGANPSHSAPHMDKHWVGEFEGTVVVVDPICTETAAKADIHLQPNPGSDAALAFAILHELQVLGAFDEDFIAQNVVGAEDLLPTLADCTPAWGEEQTGVPASRIRAAAAAYAKGPSLLWAGQALQRQPAGANIMRAIGLLPALTGNIGKPGAGITFLNVAVALLGADLDGLGAISSMDGEAPKINAIGVAEALEDPARFKAVFCWNTNPLASGADQARLRRAMEREDLFTVVVECFATDTADYADIILPAASFLEFDDLTFSYMNPIIGAQQKVREPIGLSLSNMEIFRRLSKAMGYEDAELYETDSALISDVLDQLKLNMTFEQLAEQGHVYLTEKPYDFFAENGFPTPSGKIQIASDSAADMGMGRMPRPERDQTPANGQFRLLSPASKWRLNDSYDNEEKLQDRAGAACVTIHPDDAGELGIRDGDAVMLSNATGRLQLQAKLEGIVPRGVLLSYKGRWPKGQVDGANVNVLHPSISSEIEGCTAVHGVEVALERLQPD